MEINRQTSCFGNTISELQSKKLFLFDMDGTIYEDERLFEGTKELLSLIEKNKGRYVFITNNSSKSVEDYVKKVKRLGINVNEENFFTSSQATALYLQEHYPFKKVYCQGTHSFINELQSSGIHVTETVENDIEVVVVGFDTELSFDKVRKTCELLMRGVPFIATNPDLRCPVSFGYVPDCGSICRMLINATDRMPIYIGKPEVTMIDFVREKYGYSLEETIVIGDRLYTDIASGLNAGVTAACVLTGETTQQSIIESDIKPSMVFDSVKDIYLLLNGDNKEIS